LDDFFQLTRALGRVDDPARRVDCILDWLMGVLHADGAAFIDLSAGSGRPAVLSARGALSRLNEAAAVRILAGPGSFTEPSSLTISHDGAGEGVETEWHPVIRLNGAPGDGILLHGASSSPDGNVELATALLREVLESCRLRDQLSREKSLISLLVERKIGEGSGTVNPGFDLITEGLDLPLYMCDTTGALLYTSPSFLRLVGHASAEEIRSGGAFFLAPEERAAELALLRSTGKVTSHPLAVRSGRGSRLEIRDSAVTVGAFIFGVFFDVTGFTAANKDLTDSLEIQELLNDRIIAASQTLQRTQVTSIRALARLAEFRNQETGFHLQRMCEYSRILAEKVFELQPYPFRLTATYTHDISLSAMLHDIGKVSVPDSILLKPGALTGEEWEVMKRHTMSGWEILHRADKELGEQSFLTLASIIALSHHEKYDGTGYPSGLKGDRIPLSARISALADVYDALTTRRPYKEPWSHDRAAGEIASLSGAHFDPVLVEIFRGISARFDEVRRDFPE
jgi:HD-GYP domain-containing protein (c-di-GMP phosphodiesterase class II)